MDSDAKLDFASFAADIEKLCEPGLVGFHSQWQVTEVVAFHKELGRFNLLSIVVAEEAAEIQKSGALTQLNDVRISIRDLRPWTFGVYRYTVDTSCFLNCVRDLDATGQWVLSGFPLGIGQLSPVGAKFVSPDGTVSVPLNRVLKNNFWNGSHVFEMVDTKKEHLRFITDNPSALLALSQEISKCVPISLGGLSDRIGNIVIQIPVTILTSTLQVASNPERFQVKLDWHPRATPRLLQAMCNTKFDETLSFVGFTQGTSTIDFAGHHAIHPHEMTLWDPAAEVAMGAVAPTFYLRGINVDMHLVSDNSRSFKIPLSDNDLLDQEVALFAHSTPMSIGQTGPDPIDAWSSRRLYQEDLDQKIAQKVFVQYGRNAGSSLMEHERALADIRSLISRHGIHGVWLWDPYLSATDVLKTLFFSSRSGVILRALSAGERFSDGQPRQTFDDWRAQQLRTIENCKGDQRGLNLEFRVRVGSEGWQFHDRFLIFPKTGEASLAWSLGTSVNSLGRKHHILQQVSDGQMVANAFNELWEKLTKPQHILWKVP